MVLLRTQMNPLLPHRRRRKSQLEKRKKFMLLLAKRMTPLALAKAGFPLCEEKCFTSFVRKRKRNGKTWIFTMFRFVSSILIFDEFLI
jgi:hypothetical protein